MNDPIWIEGQIAAYQSIQRMMADAIATTHDPVMLETFHSVTTLCAGMEQSWRDILAIQHRDDEPTKETPPQVRSIAMLDLIRLECSYLNDRPVVFMEDLHRLAKRNIGNERAFALRSEMCRLASWSRTPNEVAEALIAAVHADNALLDEGATNVADLPTSPRRQPRGTHDSR